MKLQVLTKNIKNIDLTIQGLNSVKAKLATIGVPFEYTISETSKNFYGVSNIYIDSTGQKITSVIVNPLDAFHSFDGYTADLFFLNYNADNVFPRPTNPSTLGKTIQMPEYWYGTYPEVFAQFFLHELCHSKSQEFGKPDLTHNQYQNPEYSQKLPTDYYLYLLKGLIPVTQPIPAPAPVPPLPVLKKGSIGEFVISLQKDLTTLGYPLKADGDFGSKTDKAVKQFQLDNRLTVDGIVGRNTYSKIDELKKNSKWGLKPLVNRKATAFITECKAQGELVRITEGFRSFARQTELYYQRPKVTNAKAGESLHNYGVAFDVCFTKTGYEGNWDKIGAIGKKLGLEWGGDFKSIKDRPHFQLTLGYPLKSFQQNQIDWSRFN